MNLNVGGFRVGSGSAGVRTGGKGCGGGCGAVFGVIFGILLVPLGLYLTYHGEIKLVNHGKVFDGITMVQPDAAASMDGELVKISGQPKGDFRTVRQWRGDALYVHTSIEEYQEETDSEGETTREWNSVGSDTQWASFSVGPIKVQPGSNTNAVGEQQVYSAYKKKFETDFHAGTEPGSPQVGDQRMTIQVLDATKPVIVVGEVSQGSIQSGGPTGTFVVSTLNEGATSQALHTEYKIAYWGIKGGAVMAIFVGIMLIFGPLTWLVGHVPFVGDSLSCGFAAIAFAIAVVSVGVITVFIKAFWILIILAVLVIAFVVIRGVTTPRGGPGAGATVPPPGAPPVQPTAPPTVSVPSAQPAVPPVSVPTATPEPPAPAPEPEGGPQFCSQCGKQLDPDSKFCQSCGAKVE